MRVLVVDDDDVIRELLSDVLTAAGYEVVTAHDEASALAAGPVSIALIDLELGPGCGAELCRRLRAQEPPPVVLLMSGGASPDLAALGAADFVAKPFLPRELIRRLDRLRAT